MANQENGKHERKNESQGSNKIQRLTLLASFLAICAPLALGVWVYVFTERPLSKAQKELTQIQVRLGSIEEKSKRMVNNLTIIEKRLSARLMAIDILYKMRPLIKAQIVKVYRHNNKPNKYYVAYTLENTGNYASYYKLDKACIVDAIDSNFSMNSVCGKKRPQETTAFRLYTPFLLAAGAKTNGLLLLDHKNRLSIGEKIYIEFETYADQKLSDMALKIANEDFKLDLKSNYFEGFASSTLTITSEPNCGKNTWCLD